MPHAGGPEQPQVNSHRLMRPLITHQASMDLSNVQQLCRALANLKQHQGSCTFARLSRQQQGVDALNHRLGWHLMQD